MNRIPFADIPENGLGGLFGTICGVAAKICFGGSKPHTTNYIVCKTSVVGNISG